ncbi:MAG: monovalent cation/H+ antiporter complex subunit F [Acidimicrobiia bacterium]|nr:monovalent cation/H+ antiporter complex subunit F [Acidimicrobiia bacterium]
MIDVAGLVALALLALAAVLCLLRMLRPCSLADRMVALDLLLLVLASGLAVQAARTGDGVYLNVMVVVALLGFVGTGLVAVFIERRGA